MWMHEKHQHQHIHIICVDFFMSFKWNDVFYNLYKRVCVSHLLYLIHVFYSHTVLVVDFHLLFIKTHVCVILLFSCDRLRRDCALDYLMILLAVVYIMKLLRNLYKITVVFRYISVCFFFTRRNVFMSMTLLITFYFIEYSICRHHIFDPFNNVIWSKCYKNMWVIYIMYICVCKTEAAGVVQCSFITDFVFLWQSVHRRTGMTFLACWTQTHLNLNMSVYGFIQTWKTETQPHVNTSHWMNCWI